MQAAPLISIVVVSYNTAQLTLYCLESIKASFHKSRYEDCVELFIVDNHSSDESVSMIGHFAQAHSRVTFIRNQKNVGFAQANNQALAQSRGSFIWLLNSDTLISPGVIESLMDQLKQHQQLGVIAPQLQYPDGRQQPQGGDLPSVLALWTFATMIDDIPILGTWLPSIQHTGRRAQTSSSLELTGWVGGTAPLFRREVYQQVGGFSELFFMYAEDVEWCWRVAEAGWLIGIDHTVTITHLGSQSSNPDTAILGELTGLLLAVEQHLSGFSLLLAKCAIYTAAITRWLLFSCVDHQKSKVYAHFLHAKMKSSHA